MELLRLEMEALEEQDFPLKITGFQEKELEKLLKGLSQKTILDPDETPELPEKATTRPGDLWILGDHRVLCGDGRRSEDLTGVLEQKTERSGILPTFPVSLTLPGVPMVNARAAILTLDCSFWRPAA